MVGSVIFLLTLGSFWSPILADLLTKIRSISLLRLLSCFRSAMLVCLYWSTSLLSSYEYIINNIINIITFLIIYAVQPTRLAHTHPHLFTKSFN